MMAAGNSVNDEKRPGIVEVKIRGPREEIERLLRPQIEMVPAGRDLPVLSVFTGLDQAKRPSDEVRYRPKRKHHSVGIYEACDKDGNSVEIHVFWNDGTRRDLDFDIVWR